MNNINNTNKMNDNEKGNNEQNANLKADTTSTPKTKHKRKVILQIVLICLLSMVLVASIYVKIVFPRINIDELLYTTQFNLGSSDLTPVYDGLKRAVPVYIVLVVVLSLLLRKTKLEKYSKTCIILFAILVIIATPFNLSFQDYAYYKLSHSTTFEENYVDSKTVDLEFPKDEDKQNLIFIFLESFESTMLDKENGGSLDYNLMPEVANLKNDEYITIFENKDGKIGSKMIDGSNHTSASLISNSSAIPFKFQITSRKLTNTHFFNNAYTLGDILKDNGYKNELISAATANYGGVKEFFTIHGNYNILDIDSIEEQGYKIEEKDKIDWGFNDGYMFEIAKQRLDVLSKENEPFNLTLVGIDTHFPRGYASEYTIDTFDSQYENVYATESKLLTEFVSYVEEQPYFENTVIVIVGDHESMECAFLDDANISQDDRYIYAAYINAKTKEETTAETFKNRSYTSLDTLPTTLSAMGVKITGNQLGMGINMFSSTPTLAEKLGVTKLDEELRKTSKEYTKLFYEGE